MVDHSINAGAIQGRVPDQLFERLEGRAERSRKFVPRQAIRFLIEQALAASDRTACDEAAAS